MNQTQFLHSGNLVFQVFPAYPDSVLKDVDVANRPAKWFVLWEKGSLVSYLFYFPV